MPLYTTVPPKFYQRTGFCIGDEVEILDHGIWYPGQIVVVYANVSDALDFDVADFDIGVDIGRTTGSTSSLDGHLGNISTGLWSGIEQYHERLRLPGKIQDFSMDALHAILSGNH